MTVLGNNRSLVNIAMKLMNTNRMRVYPANGLVPLATVTPFVPDVMVRCLKYSFIVDAG